MPRPKAVIFDLGKVLVDFDYQVALRRLAPLSDLGLDAWNRLVNQSPLLLRYESGHMTSAEFFAEVRAASGFRGDLAGFGAIFGDIFVGIEPMIALHAEVCSRGWPTYVFSNTNELAVRHMREHFPFFRTFTGLVLSFEHGALKPDPRLYEAVERVSGCRGNELFYLDDRPENVAVATARGWQAHVHEDPDATREAVRAAGLLQD